MRTMMLALTDQEGGVGMNESSDRLGQAVFERLPCSSFKRQQTPQYIFAILRDPFFSVFFANTGLIVIIIDFLHCQFRAGKAISGHSDVAYNLLINKRLYSYTDSIRKITDV